MKKKEPAVKAGSFARRAGIFRLCIGAQPDTYPTFAPEAQSNCMRHLGKILCSEAFATDAADVGASAWNPYIRVSLAGAIFPLK